MKLVLNNSGISLAFTVNDTGWCSLQLIENGVTHALGAESVAVVKRRMTSALGDPKGAAATTLIRNLEVCCVLNLHVKPWSIYLGRSDKRRHLFFRNREEGLVIETVLSESDCSRWLEALKDLSDRAVADRRPCVASSSSVAAAQ